MVKYREIGNEMGGSWAANYCKTGTEYAQRYCQFYKVMKAVDPTIKLGANAGTREDCNGGWNGLMFTECLNRGIVPGFLIIHAYPALLRPVTPENDAICPAAIADIKTYTDNINAIVNQYVGPEYVGKIEYSLTEFIASHAVIWIFIRETAQSLQADRQVKSNYTGITAIGSAMDQSDDYSSNPLITMMSDYMKIGLYRNGKLIWGTEPEGLKPPPLLGATPAPTPSISRTAAPGAATTRTAAPSVTEPPGGLTGDVNGSRTVDIVGARMIAQYYVGLNPAGFNSSVADINCTGTIDIVDALLTAQYYVGLVSGWPC